MFILAANVAPRVVERLGPEPVIFVGTALSALGAAGILLFAVAGGSDPLLLAALFVPMNLGPGLRGPPGFYRAVVAARGDDARGSALVILLAFLVAAGGTAAVAPWIEEGLVPLAGCATGLATLSVVALLMLPKLVESAPAD